MPLPEIHRSVFTQYGESERPRRSAHEWIAKFKSSRRIMKIKERAGYPLTFTTDEKITQTRELIMANRRVII